MPTHQTEALLIDTPISVIAPRSHQIGGLARGQEMEGLAEALLIKAPTSVVVQGGQTEALLVEAPMPASVIEPSSQQVEGLAEALLDEAPKSVIVARGQEIASLTEALLVQAPSQTEALVAPGCQQSADQTVDSVAVVTIETTSQESSSSDETTSSSDNDEGAPISLPGEAMFLVQLNNQVRSESLNQISFQQPC